MKLIFENLDELVKFIEFLGYSKNPSEKALESIDSSTQSTQQEKTLESIDSSNEFSREKAHSIMMRLFKSNGKSATDRILQKYGVNKLDDVEDSDLYELINSVREELNK